MARPAAAATLAVLALTLSGCSGLQDLLTTGCSVTLRSDITESVPWNRDGRFEVEAPDNVPVSIHATSQSGQSMDGSGTRKASVELPDGTWTITYKVDGRDCTPIGPVRIDGTPPSLSGLALEQVAEAGARVTVGQGVVVGPGARIEVIDASNGALLSTTIPYRTGPLEDGIHLFQVRAVDPAGNVASATVQVRVGDSAKLPDGEFTFGVVGRYSNQVRLWDISDESRYLSRSQAALEAPGHLGPGYGIDPNHASVQSVVAQVVTPRMNTEEAARALYIWMAGNLKYDFSRLESTTLLTPQEVILDAEHPDDADADGDGLSDPGSGNGVKGGVCRDLAATYVSLLRAAGVPARLVSGYLGGQVNGFHAWVQFYGGVVGSQDPWVVVDVASINGVYKPDMLVGSFGIQPTDFLALRNIPPSGEVKGWSNALGVQYEWRGDERPSITFDKKVTPQYDEKGVLCFNLETFARRLASSESACGSGYGHYIPGMVLRTDRLIDYGIKVVSAPDGTTVKAEVAYPLIDAVRPNGVTYRFYGQSYTLDAAAGKANSEFRIDA